MLISCQCLHIKFQCPNATEVEAFAAAVSDGVITWHAGPMNLQTDNVHAPWLLEAGVAIGSRLDTRFGVERKMRVLSQRDVPGG